MSSEQDDLELGVAGILDPTVPNDMTHVVTEIECRPASVMRPGSDPLGCLPPFPRGHQSVPFDAAGTRHQPVGDDGKRLQ